MPNLKLGLIPDEKPVKLTVELPANVHRDLIAYGEVLARETGQAVLPGQLVAPMLARFMSADRGFAKVRRSPVTVQNRSINPSDAPTPAHAQHSGTA
jgi:hypothetical protein